MATAEINYTLHHDTFTLDERRHIARRLGEAVLFFHSDISLARIEQPINGMDAEYLPAELEHNLSCDMADFRAMPTIRELDGRLSLEEVTDRGSTGDTLHDSYYLQYVSARRVDGYASFSDAILAAQMGIERSFGQPLQQRLDGESGVLLTGGTTIPKRIHQ